MKIYHYDTLGVFAGSEDAFESPLEPGTYLVPANATSVAPPAVGENQAAVLTGNVWNIVADFRAHVRYNSSGASVTLALGQSPDATTSATPRPHVKASLSPSGEWVMPPEAIAEIAAAHAELTSAAAARATLVAKYGSFEAAVSALLHLHTRALKSAKI